MKTIYAEAQPGKVVLKEKEIPAPGKGEVLLKAKYSAMSPGTENGLLGEHIVPLPTSIGYAMAAEVIEVGEDVEWHCETVLKNTTWQSGIFWRKMENRKTRS